VGVQETFADGTRIGETGGESVLVEIVVEQAPDATRLAAVAQEEVLVAPALVCLVARLAAEGFAQVAGHPVPVPDVLVEGIERRQVEAAAKPPHRSALTRLRLEEAH